MAKALPLQRISELLEYDPTSGKLYWKVARGRGVVAGKEAGTLTNNGYYQVYVDNYPYLCHRIAYALMTDKEIFGNIDHIDGIRTNNTYSNLRELSPEANARNRFSKGYSKVSSRWAAKITYNYKQIYLGTFDTEEEAKNAYICAKRKYHPESLERIIC